MPSPKSPEAILKELEAFGMTVPDGALNRDDILVRVVRDGAVKFSLTADEVLALRRAAIAGEALADAIEEIAPTTNARGSLDFEVFRYRSAIEEKNN